MVEANKAFEVLLERATEGLAKATRLADDITSEEKWIEFDQTCHAVESDLADALALDVIIPPELEKEFEDSIWKITSLRVRVWEDWQMLLREQQAIADPTGRYGLMKRQREVLTAALQDGDDGWQRSP